MSATARRRHRKVEGRALAGLRGEPDASTVALDDLAAERQPHAAAGDLRMEAPEHGEDLVGLRRLDADAVVAHREGPLAGSPLRTEVDAGRGLAAEFDRITDQI